MSKTNEELAIPQFYHRETNTERLTRKIKENPFFPIGLTGFAVLVIYRLAQVRKRQYPLSLHLIHTRMMAQGFAVGVIGLGAFYTLGKNVYRLYINPGENTQEDEAKSEIK